MLYINYSSLKLKEKTIVNNSFPNIIINFYYETFILNKNNANYTHRISTIIKQILAKPWLRLRTRTSIPNLEVSYESPYILFSFAYFLNLDKWNHNVYITQSLVFLFKIKLWNSPMMTHIAQIVRRHCSLVFHCITIPGFTYPFSYQWIFVGFLGFVIINNADVNILVHVSGSPCTRVSVR